MAHHCKPSDLWGTAEAAQPEIALDKAQMAPGCAYQDDRSKDVSHCGVPLLTTRHSMPRANQYTISDLVPPPRKIFQTHKNWHLKTLFGRRSQVRTSPDGRVNRPEPLFPPPKKGRLFGKSHASDFVRRTPGNTLLTKVLNRCL